MAINFSKLSDEEKLELFKQLGSDPIILNKDKKSSISDEITQNGYVKNMIHRRWITAQTLRMIGVKKGVMPVKDMWTDRYNRRSFVYMWHVLLNEMESQEGLAGNEELLSIRQRFFNIDVIKTILTEYVQLVDKHLRSKKSRYCKGIPYIRVGGSDIFVADINRKILNPLKSRIKSIKSAKDLRMFINCNEFIKLPRSTRKPKAFTDAYKGAGAYYTLENLIRYSKFDCPEFEDVLGWYQMGDGYRLHAILVKTLKENKKQLEDLMKSW